MEGLLSASCLDFVGQIDFRSNFYFGGFFSKVDNFCRTEECCTKNEVEL